jgi:hypothetical protein
MMQSLYRVQGPGNLAKDPSDVISDDVRNGMTARLDLARPTSSDSTPC